MMKHQDTKQGFTLLIAIVITATLLLISTSIIAFAVRQAFIADTGRQSQLAFYAADTGMECAIYWDVHNPSGNSAFSTSTSQTVTCNHDSNNSGNTWTVGGSSMSVIGPITYLPFGSCANVTVTKNADGSTQIESKGYNTCTTSARRVERAIRVTYMGGFAVPNSYILTVSKSGTGSGTVTGNGINCGSTR